MPFRSAYNENAELDNAGVDPGAGGFGFYLPALKNGLQQNLSKQEPAKSDLVGFFHVELGFRPRDTSRDAKTQTSYYLGCLGLPQKSGRLQVHKKKGSNRK